MKHYIIVKFNSEVEKSKIGEMAVEIKNLFDKTKEIDGVHEISVYKNCIDRDNRYDLMIEMDMEKSALTAYDESKWHAQWKKEYGHLLASKTIFDRE